MGVKSIGTLYRHEEPQQVSVPTNIWNHQKQAPPAGEVKGGACLVFRGLSVVTLAFLKLLHDLLDREAGRLLTGRKLFKARNPIGDECLGGDEQEDTA
jgi:hypothetical protein